MTQARTKATDASVDEYLASQASQEQLAYCKALMAMLERVTKHSAKMWGPSIVGYGSYRYTYVSGRTGESCLAGFAIQGRDLVVYLVAADPAQKALLAALGRHKLGQGLPVLQAAGGSRPRGARATRRGVCGRVVPSPCRAGRHLMPSITSWKEPHDRGFVPLRIGALDAR
jgi:hypothetical protein